MNRIISLSVEDMYIKYTGEAFGATGSHNAVTLRMTFGPAWEGTAKTAYFTDALGNASVALVLGLDTLVDGAYEVDVPSEALKTAGVATITIKGVLVSGETTTKAITTAAGHFRVLDSELPDSAGSAGTITPSDKDQLQAEIAGMEALFTTAKAAAETAAANAKAPQKQLRPRMRQRPQRPTQRPARKPPQPRRAVRRLRLQAHRTAQHQQHRAPRRRREQPVQQPMRQVLPASRPQRHPTPRLRRRPAQRRRHRAPPAWTVSTKPPKAGR